METFIAGHEALSELGAARATLQNSIMEGLDGDTGDASDCGAAWNPAKKIAKPKAPNPSWFTQKYGEKSDEYNAAAKKYKKKLAKYNAKVGAAKASMALEAQLKKDMAKASKEADKPLYKKLAAQAKGLAALTKSSQTNATVAANTATATQAELKELSEKVGAGIQQGQTATQAVQTVIPASVQMAMPAAFVQQMTSPAYVQQIPGAVQIAPAVADAAAQAPPNAVAPQVPPAAFLPAATPPAATAPGATQQPMCPPCDCTSTLLALGIDPGLLDPGMDDGTDYDAELQRMLDPFSALDDGTDGDDTGDAEGDDDDDIDGDDTGDAEGDDAEGDDDDCDGGCDLEGDDADGEDD